MSFCSLFQLCQNHGGYFFRCKFLPTLQPIDNNFRLPVVFFQFVGQFFHFFVNNRILVGSSDNSLHIEDSILRVCGSLCLSCTSN
mmetsp:Transcript_11655/g.16787  ORF Transcript_11655/g.16787 Transcript_11655/m.16787 type:complete len:85 (+) Transcript_11655:1471-1725(+)